jgi:uncharacterized protein (DUF2141 family)
VNIGRGVKSWAVAVVLALILTIEVQGLTMMNGQVKVRMYAYTGRWVIVVES